MDKSFFSYNSKHKTSYGKELIAVYIPVDSLSKLTFFSSSRFWWQNIFIKLLYMHSVVHTHFSNTDKYVQSGSTHVTPAALNDQCILH